MATKVHDRLSGAIDACAIGLLSATLRDSVHKLDSSINLNNIKIVLKEY